MSGNTFFTFKIFPLWVTSKWSKFGQFPRNRTKLLNIAQSSPDLSMCQDEAFRENAWRFRSILFYFTTPIPSFMKGSFFPYLWNATYGLDRIFLSWMVLNDSAYDRSTNDLCSFFLLMYFGKSNFNHLWPVASVVRWPQSQSFAKSLSSIR